MTTPKAITEIIIIEDWEKRFQLANYSSDQRRIVNLSLERMREWFEVCNKDDWTNQANSDGLKIDYRTSSRGFNTLKACATLPFNIMEIFETMCNADYRSLYDVNIDPASYTVKRIAANTTAIYQKSKKILIV